MGARPRGHCLAREGVRIRWDKTDEGATVYICFPTRYHWQFDDVIFSLSMTARVGLTGI